MPGESLYESLAELRVAQCQLHGVLVQVHGRGVILTGESGVGKTRCAIELVRRGHTFISDDAVQIVETGAGLFGRVPETMRSLVHVRGLGISNVAHLFAQAVICDECRIDLSIEIYGREERSHLLSMTEHMPGVPIFHIEANRPTIIADRVEAIVRENFPHLVL